MMKRAYRLRLLALLLALLMVFGMSGAGAESAIASDKEPGASEVLQIIGPSALSKGGTAILSVERPNGTSDGYEWTSSVPAVATIDQSGRLTAVGGGETQIMARDTTDSALFATLKLTVSDPVTAIALMPATAKLQVGEGLNLQTRLSPENATNHTLTWSSSAPLLASVDADGTVRGLAVGSVRITARADGGVTGSMDIAVVPPTSAIRVTTLEGQSVSADVALNKDLQLLAVAYPNGTAVEVNWSSSNAAAVSVSPSGLARALKAGDSEIVATLKGDGAVKHSIKIRAVIPVAEVKLNKGELDLSLSDTAELTASVFPKDATERGLGWSSSSPAVVAVTPDGKLTARGVGKATITVASKNRLTAICVVNVTDKEAPGNGGGAGSITIMSEQGASATLYVGQSLKLTASVSGVTWKSSAADYVSVSKDGKITAAKAKSMVTITATAANGAVGSFLVCVLKGIKSIKIGSAVAYTNGDPVDLKLTTSPKGGVLKLVSWSVVGDAATVSSAGRLTGVKDGEVTVIAATDTGLKASRKVKVRTLPSDISLNQAEGTITAGKKLKLKAKLDGSEPAIKWTTSNKKIATVSNSGTVKGLKAGTVTITATTKNGLTASCTITVLKKASARSLAGHDPAEDAQNQTEETRAEP